MSKRLEKALSLHKIERFQFALLASSYICFVPRRYCHCHTSQRRSGVASRGAQFVFRHVSCVSAHSLTPLSPPTHTQHQGWTAANCLKENSAPHHRQSELKTSLQRSKLKAGERSNYIMKDVRATAKGVHARWTFSRIDAASARIFSLEAARAWDAGVSV